MFAMSFILFVWSYYGTCVYIKVFIPRWWMGEDIRTPIQKPKACDGMFLKLFSQSTLVSVGCYTPTFFCHAPMHTAACCTWGIMITTCRQASMTMMHQYITVPLHWPHRITHSMVGDHFLLSYYCYNWCSLVIIFCHNRFSPWGTGHLIGSGEF